MDNNWQGHHDNQAPGQPHQPHPPHQPQPEHTPPPHQPAAAVEPAWQPLPPTPTEPHFSPQSPEPPQLVQSGGNPDDIVPQPVVQVLSPRGVEYVFMAIALVTGALGLISALLSLVNGETGFDILAFPLALLLVSVPVFAWLFLRLKNAELANPALKLDASKRRTTQSIQILSFLAVFFTLIGFVSIIMAKIGGHYDGSLVKVFLNIIVILLVSGGILFYYWRDEHKQ